MPDPIKQNPAVHGGSINMSIFEIAWTQRGQRRTVTVIAESQEMAEDMIMGAMLDNMQIRSIGEADPIEKPRIVSFD